MRLMNVGPLFTALALVLVLAAPAAAQIEFTATLDGAQENPPVATAGSGTGTFTLLANDMLEYNIEFSGLNAPESAAHFHGPAAVGTNAGVTFGLPAGSPKIGEVGPLSAQQKTDLMAGLWYVNIHTTAHTGGEIRGQVILSSVSNDDESFGEIKIQFEN